MKESIAICIWQPNLKRRPEESDKRTTWRTQDDSDQRCKPRNHPFLGEDGSNKFFHGPVTTSSYANKMWLPHNIYTRPDTEQHIVHRRFQEPSGNGGHLVPIVHNLFKVGLTRQRSPCNGWMLQTSAAATTSGGRVPTCWRRTRGCWTCAWQPAASA